MFEAIVRRKPKVYGDCVGQVAKKKNRRFKFHGIIRYLGYEAHQSPLVYASFFYRFFF